jgi:heat shock protein HslJ
MKQAKRLLLVLAFTLAACAPITVPATPTPLAPTPPVDAPPGIADDLVGTQWMLVSYGTLGAETPVVEGSEVTLAFQEDGQAVGFGGCNSYGGPYVAEDGVLSFGEVVSTLVACLDEQVMEQEQQYFQALQTAGQYELAADRLTIYYDGGQGVLNFAPALAPA